jgi:hypothetical protein
VNPSAAERARLAFLFRVVGREAAHLRSSDGRVFARPMTPERVAGLAADIDDSERIEAFVARFARLQDTLGDKLLPAVLLALGEPVGAAIDNLDRGERLGLLPSADQWIAARRLRNRMVHEYVEDPGLLAAALQQGHACVPLLLAVEAALRAEGRHRGWIDDRPA